MSYVDPDLSSIERAYVTSESKTEFFGAPLAPFSGRLVLAAQAIGIRLFTLSKEQLDKFSVEDEASLYDGFLLDAATVVWLRLQDQNTVLRATMNKKWALERIMNWVDSINMSFSNEAGKHVIQAFTEALSDVAASSPVNNEKK
jgi:hypothetical protein